MKWNQVVKSVVLGLAVLLATSAFASNKGSLHLLEASQVSGQQLPAGEYQLRWDGTGSNVAVSILQGKKEVAKTTAKVIDLNQPSEIDSVTVDRSGATPSLLEIHFSGKKYALRIEGADNGAMAEGSSK